MIGYASYRGEEVIVIEIVWNCVKRRSEYLINYSGPIWVGEDDLSRVVLVA